MANSYIEYTSGLTATTYDVPFNFLSIDDVKVKGYNGTTWSDLTVASTDASAKTVTLDVAPSAYQKIRVWRNTGTTQLVDFQNGSRLSESDLDTAYQQGLFVAQEVSENASTVTAAATSNVSLSGTTTVADLDVTGDVDVTGDLEVTGNLKVDTIQDTTGTSAMTIDSDGNVGISTGSPQKTLDVKGTFAISNSTTSYWDFDRNDSDGSLTISDTGTERMRISSSGDLLIGTDDSIIYNHNSTSESGLVLVKDGYYSAARKNGPTQFLNRQASDGSIVDFYRDGSLKGTISITSSSVSYNTSSDYRLKENVVDLTGATDRLKQLNPSRFNFIADADTTVDGFLAHEVQTVVPEAITGTHNEVDADGNPVYQGIDQSKLVPLLVATIKELEARITALENA